MIVELRTSSWQLFAIGAGWILIASFATLGFSSRPSPIGAGISLLVLGYMAWTYPLRCVISNSSVMIHSAFRKRIIDWEDVVAFRRTKGVWRHQLVAGRRRLRPTTGAPLIVMEGGRTVLLLGHVEPRLANSHAVAILETVSPALAMSLRLADRDGQ